MKNPSAKNPKAKLIAATLPLLLTSLPIFADELPSRAAEPASVEAPALHWSASIGTGLAASAPIAKPVVTSNNESNGVTASPHWTAAIGTGTAANKPDSAQSSPSVPHPVVATAHWTARIGTGHPFDSASPVMLASSTNSR